MKYKDNYEWNIVLVLAFISDPSTKLIWYALFHALNYICEYYAFLSVSFFPFLVFIALKFIIRLVYLKIKYFMESLFANFTCVFSQQRAFGHNSVSMCVNNGAHRQNISLYICDCWSGIKSGKVVTKSSDAKQTHFCKTL